MVDSTMAKAGVENRVVLAGKVAAPPEERELPSGDLILTCRLIVARDIVRALPNGRRGPSVDVFDLVAWSGRSRRSMGAWKRDDQVVVSGQLRRRFYRVGGGGAQSRIEVEVSSARRTRRSATG